MKPDFFSLPWCIQERMLWDMELDYCPYESSKESCIHNISNGNLDNTNKLIIINYYKNITVDTLKVYADQELETVQWVTNSLNALKKQLTA